MTDTRLWSPECTQYSSQSRNILSSRCECLDDSATEKSRLTSLTLHVIFTLFLVELTFLFGGSILVLLVLRDEVIHIALSLRKLHLIHALTCVPVKEGFPPEHGRKEFSNTLEHLLDCRRIPEESDCHLQPLRRNITDPDFDVVRDPLTKY